MAYNVWWVGRDGNVYTRIGDTVTSQGKLINDYGQAGFDAERLSAGDIPENQLDWARIDDPVAAPVADAAPTTNRTASAAGTGASAPVLNQAAVDATQRAIDSLGTEERVGMENIDREYNSLMGRYGQEAARATADFNEGNQTNQGNLAKNKQNALLAGAQGRRGLRGVLGSIGALFGDGSKLADRAVMESTNDDIGAAADTFAGNAANLTKAKTRFDEEDKVRRDEAGTARENQRTAKQGEILSKRQRFLQDMAKLFGDAEQTGRQGELLREAGGLNEGIAQKTAVAATPFQAKSAAFTPGSLESYLAGAGDMTVAAVPTTGSPTGSTLLAGRGGRRRLEEEELVAA